MKNTIGMLVLLAGMCVSAIAVSDDAVHWSYSGHEGSEYWGELAPGLSICSSGKNQSPVNLTAMIEGELSEIKYDYKSGGHEILNNGHTVL